MRIYLDNNATTEIHPVVLSTLQESFRQVFGNASSIHQEGQRARRTIEEAREAVAILVGAAPREIVFTSGGTESNNAALHGAALSGRSTCHIVTSSIEHPSVMEPVRHLAGRGCEATFVPCGPEGRVEAARVFDAIRPDTRVVSVMLANNETGVIQPVEEIGRFCRERGIHFHCDAVQGPGKTAVSVDSIHADTLSIAAHKVHGPKGIGALYVRSGSQLGPLIQGGAQERRRRAGTESVPLAAAFGTAAALIASDGLQRPELRDGFEARAVAAHAGAFVNGASAQRLPNTSSICFPDVDGEALVIALDLAGVAVSSGSACSSGRTEPSHVLLAMGLSEDHAKSSARFSLSRFSTSEELDRTALLLEQLLPGLRRRRTQTT